MSTNNINNNNKNEDKCLNEYKFFIVLCLSHPLSNFHGKNCENQFFHLFIIIFFANLLIVLCLLPCERSQILQNLQKKLNFQKKKNVFLRNKKTKQKERKRNDGKKPDFMY